MSDDIKDKVRAGIRAQVEKLISDGYSVEDVQALVPKLQAEVKKRLTPFGPPAPDSAQSDEMRLAAMGRQKQEYDEKYGKYEKPTGIESVGRAITGGLAGGATLGFSSPENRLTQAGNALTLARRTGASEDSMRRLTEEFNLAKAEVQAGQEHPYVAGAASLVGGAYGPGARVGKAVTEGLKDSARLVPRLLAGGAAGGAVEGAGRGVASGQDLGGIAQDTLEGSAAGIVGAGAGYVAGKGLEAAGKVSKKVREYATAKRAGLYDDPEMKSLPSGAKGNQRASEIARDRVLTRDDEIASEAQQAYRNAVDPRVKTPIDPDAVRAPLRDLAEANQTSTGANVNPGVPPMLRRVTDGLGYEPDVGDALKLRRAIGEEAGFGAAAPTQEQLAARKVYGALRQSVRQAAPEVAQADDAFANYKRGQARRNDILFRSEDGGRPVDLPDHMGPEAASLAEVPSARQAMRIGDEMKAATAIGRFGDDSVEAQRLAPYLEELAGQDPKFKEALDFLLAKKALEATSPSLSPVLQTNLNQAVSLGGMLNVGKQNARALGRTTFDLGDALSSNAAEATGGAAALKNPVVSAYRNQQERKEKEQRELSEKLKARRGRKE